MNEHKKSLQKAENISRFFDEILDVVRNFMGNELVESFKRIKTQRDRYLREQWADHIHDIGPIIIRDIDYDHLITVLDSSLENSFPQLFKLYIAIVRICLQYGEFEKSRILLIKLSDLIGNEEQQAEVEMLFGKLNLLTNQWNKSTEHYINALKIYKKIKDDQGIAKTYNNLGINSYEQWKTDQGKQYLEKAEKITDAISDDGLNLIVQINLGIVQNIRGAFIDAKNTFNKLLSKLDRKNLPGIATILVNKGMAARDAHHFEDAAETLIEAIDISKKIQSRRLLALAYLAKSEVDIYLNNYSVSNENLSSSFTIFAQRHDKLHLADVYRVFGLLHLFQDHYELADSEFKMSVRINTEYNEILTLARAYEDYSLLSKKLGDTATQKKRLQKALELFNSIQAVKRAERVENELKALA